MSVQLSFDFEAPLLLATRHRDHERTPSVARVVYSRYPRSVPGEAEREGFTIDRSAAGLCVLVRQPEAPGAVLRLRGRDMDDRPTFDLLGRVVWSRQTAPGRHRVGLQIFAAGRRHPRPARTAAPRRTFGVSGRA